MHGPQDPRASGRSYAKKGAEPVKQTGQVGPQARGATEKRHQDTKPPASTNLAVGLCKPSASQK